MTVRKKNYPEGWFSIGSTVLLKPELQVFRSSRGRRGVLHTRHLVRTFRNLPPGSHLHLGHLHDHGHPHHGPVRRPQGQDHHRDGHRLILPQHKQPRKYFLFPPSCKELFYRLGSSMYYYYHLWIHLYNCNYLFVLCYIIIVQWLLGLVNF